MSPPPVSWPGAFGPGRMGGMVWGMTATVVNIRPDKAPPSTDFERDACDALLASIRAMRDESGISPQSVNWVILGHDDGRENLGYRVGWFNEAPDGMRMRFAYAAALLNRQATDEC